MLSRFRDLPKALTPEPESPNSEASFATPKQPEAWDKAQEEISQIIEKYELSLLNTDKLFKVVREAHAMANANRVLKRRVNETAIATKARKERANLPRRPIQIGGVLTAEGARHKTKERAKKEAQQAAEKAQRMVKKKEKAEEKAAAAKAAKAAKAAERKNSRKKKSAADIRTLLGMEEGQFVFSIQNGELQEAS